MTVKLAVAGAFHTEYMKPAEDSLRCARLSPAPYTSQRCAREQKMRAVRSTYAFIVLQTLTGTVHAVAQHLQLVLQPHSTELALEAEAHTFGIAGRRWHRRRCWNHASQSSPMWTRSRTQTPTPSRTSLRARCSLRSLCAHGHCLALVCPHGYLFARSGHAAPAAYRRSCGAASASSITLEDRV